MTTNQTKIDEAKAGLNRSEIIRLLAGRGLETKEDFEERGLDTPIKIRDLFLVIMGHIDTLDSASIDGVDAFGLIAASVDAGVASQPN
tara:strand:+ start:293 stop:556 length:264 start_codon:yes stop_codon:yes gene_type:complete